MLADEAVVVPTADAEDCFPVPERA